MRKKYQVIDIINSHSLVINYGTKDGAKVGEKIRIFEDGEEIFDLSGKSLGNVDIIKTDLEIEKIFDNFSICCKFKIVDVNPFKSLDFNKTEKVYQSFSINLNDVSNIKYTSEDPIKKGDFAKIIK